LGHLTLNLALKTIQDIPRLLAANEIIHSIELWGVFISADAIRLIGHAVQGHKSLSNFVFWNIRLGDAVEAMRSMQENSPALREHGLLGCCSLGATGCRKLFSELTGRVRARR
jgi:hypothetical protein